MGFKTQAFLRFILFKSLNNFRIDLFLFGKCITMWEVRGRAEHTTLGDLSVDALLTRNKLFGLSCNYSYDYG